MNVIWSLGGLGNQMFQYAFYRTLQLNSNDAYLDISLLKKYPLHNGYELESIFNIKPKIASNTQLYKTKNSLIFKVLRKLKLYNAIIIQDGIGFKQEYLMPKNNTYLIGYWQSEKYFIQHAKQIHKDFAFPSLDPENESIAQMILSTNSVSIHVRMGDYVNHPLHGNICTLEYYQQAISIIKQKINNPMFFIFSNDIEWCKQNLNIDNGIYITGNNGVDSYKDMQLMSLCKHNIIANSSFSWWGAWLNNNSSKIVIAPSKWFNDTNIYIQDLIPESWTKI